MPVEFIGYVGTQEVSEIIPPSGPVIDTNYARSVALAHEAGGFDRVLVGYFSDGPDGFLIAAAAAAHTERLGFLLAHRPGYVAPTLAARKFATLDQITGGRAAIRMAMGPENESPRRTNNRPVGSAASTSASSSS